MMGGLDALRPDEGMVADRGPVREKLIVIVSVGSIESCRLGIFGLDIVRLIAPLPLPPSAPNPLGSPSPSPTPPPAVVGTEASGSNPSSAGLANRLKPRKDPLVEMNRGFLPLSRTFLRALALTQTIICRRASRSLTVRPGLRAVPVRGVNPIGRGMVD